MKKFTLCLIIGMIAVSCVKEGNSTQKGSINVRTFAPGLRDSQSSQSDASSLGTVTWTTDDVIGIVPHDDEKNEAGTSQLGVRIEKAGVVGNGYSTQTGWRLVENGYHYLSYFPFSPDLDNGVVSINYHNQEQITDATLQDLGQWDFMYSDPAQPISKTELFLNFHHIGSQISINMTIPEEFKDETIYKMKLIADTAVFTYEASYVLDSLMYNDDGKPKFQKKNTDIINLSFGEDGIKPEDGSITARMMMFPSEIKDCKIDVKLYTDKYYVVPTIEGSITPSSSHEAGKKYTYSATMRKSNQTLPCRAGVDNQFHILLFGHSFGQDCMEYLLQLVKNAGFSNIHFARWYQGGAPLSAHWGHVVNGSPYDFYWNDAGQTVWNFKTRSVEEVIAETPWDIIIMQTGIGMSYYGNNTNYQPYLDNMNDYLSKTCKKYHNKIPVIGWNMIWGYNTTDNTYKEMYESIVTATKDMMKDTGMSMIIPSGTTMENARTTSVAAANPLLLRDWLHASSGIGRYILACTWFEKLIAPVYGGSITNDTYRPGSGYDAVTDANAPILYKCVQEAIDHPFEVSEIDE